MQADVLVSSQGVCAQKIISAGCPQVLTPNTGDVTVSGGFASVRNVIHTNCCKWDGAGGSGEVVSIYLLLFYSSVLVVLFNLQEM